MRWFIGSLLMIILVSCNKVIKVELPDYQSEITVEMYLEEGAPLRCVVSESLPYTDTSFVRPVDDALVIFSDGTSSDTLLNKLTNDGEAIRYYNYFNPKRIWADTTKTYTLTITDKKNRVITGTTRFPKRITRIDSVISKPSVNNADSFSVGVAISDPEDAENYYRFMIEKKPNDFTIDPTDFPLNDIAFNGKVFSYFSEPVYARNDTVVVKVYSLLKDHYNYIQSAAEARSSNFNPLAQPARIKSNVTGGLGIFAATRYDRKTIIVR